MNLTFFANRDSPVMLGRIVGVAGSAVGVPPHVAQRGVCQFSDFHLPNLPWVFVSHWEVVRGGIVLTNPNTKILVWPKLSFFCDVFFSESCHGVLGLPMLSSIEVARFLPVIFSFGKLSRARDRCQKPSEKRGKRNIYFNFLYF